MSRFVRNSEVQGQWNGTGLRAKAIQKLCAMCGTGLMSKAKTYCGPCYDERLQANIAASRHKYKYPKP